MDLVKERKYANFWFYFSVVISFINLVMAAFGSPETRGSFIFWGGFSLLGAFFRYYQIKLIDKKLAP